MEGDGEPGETLGLALRLRDTDGRVRESDGVAVVLREREVQVADQDWEPVQLQDWLALSDPEAVGRVGDGEAGAVGDAVTVGLHEVLGLRDCERDALALALPVRLVVGLDVCEIERVELAEVLVETVVVQVAAGVRVQVGELLKEAEREAVDSVAVSVQVMVH